MIVLYGPTFAPYTEKVRRALLFKGLSFQLREPQSAEDFKRWSPMTGKLPVLEIDGDRTPDSTEILHKLDALYPSPPLLAPEPHVRAQQVQLENWADESFAFYFNRWMNIRRVAEGDEGAKEHRGIARYAAARRFSAWLRAGGTFERPEADLLRNLGARLDDLINFLGARPYFYADRLSMADLGVYGMLFTMMRDFVPGSSKLVTERTLLLDYMRRVESTTEGSAAA